MNNHGKHLVFWVTFTGILVLMELYFASGKLFEPPIFKLSARGNSTIQNPAAQWLVDNASLADAYLFFQRLHQLDDADNADESTIFIVGSSTAEVFDVRMLSDRVHRWNGGECEDIHNFALGGNYNASLLTLYITEKLVRSGGRGTIVWMSTIDDYLDTRFQTVFEDRMYFQFFYSPKLLWDLYGRKILPRADWHLKKFLFSKSNLVRYSRFIPYRFERFFVSDNDPAYHFATEYQGFEAPQKSMRHIVEDIVHLLERQPAIDPRRARKLEKRERLECCRKWAAATAPHFDRRIIVLLPLVTETEYMSAYLKQALSKENYTKLYARGSLKTLEWSIAAVRLRELCRKSGIELYDLRGRDDLFTPEDFADIWHLNRKGQKKLAGELSQIFTPSAR
jgi:hypothetical protein